MQKCITANNKWSSCQARYAGSTAINKLDILHSSSNSKWKRDKQGEDHIENLETWVSGLVEMIGSVSESVYVSKYSSGHYDEKQLDKL